jgi:hypothetical protein
MSMPSLGMLNFHRQTHRSAVNAAPKAMLTVEEVRGHGFGRRRAQCFTSAWDARKRLKELRDG